MSTYHVTAWCALPHYTTFEVQADSLEEALVKAKEQVLDECPEPCNGGGYEWDEFEICSEDENARARYHVEPSRLPSALVVTAFRHFIIAAFQQEKTTMAIDPTMIVSYDTNMQDTITQAEYKAFQQAYDFFNAQLFAGTLPNVLVTLQRHAKAYGYFSPERFIGRAEKEAAHELAMNPDHFGRTDELILATLVHEMAHVWQKAHGKMPRRGYHDKQWAAKMKEIGLQPSDTAQPGGRETGQQMGHYVIKDGPFAVAFAKLQATGFKLRWQSRTEVDPTRKAKKASKTKYTCPSCGVNAWAKPDTLLICGECYDEGEGDICLMEADEPEEAEQAA